MIFDTFPREFGAQRLIAKDMDHFLKLINTSNGKINCFTTVYSFTESREDGRLNYESAIIDKIFFDFDTIDCIDEGISLHEFLMEKDLKHSFLWSGGGLHCYIYTDNKEAIHKKSAIKNAQIFFTEFNGKKLKLDQKVVGDICRLGRIPNTWNLKRKKYCIPITVGDMKKGREHLEEKAKKQNTEFSFYGVKLLNLDRFDYPNNDFSDDLQDFKLPDKIETDDDLFNKIPDCIKFLLLKGDCDHNERFPIILYLKDALNYTKAETIEVLKKYLTEKKFYHCIFEERQVEHLYYRSDILFPSPRWFKAKGIYNCVCKEGIYK